MNILDKILEVKRRETVMAKRIRGFDDILEEARSVERHAVSFSGALAASATGIIAEFKRKSPSKGFIKRDADASAIVRDYTNNGAAAISVLTDSEFFAGSLDDLKKAREVTGLPLLRKDFIIDRYQICEARIAGADVVLLIAAALTPKQCGELAAFAASLGMEVLLELHGPSELGHINENISVVGINNRDLATFVTDTEVSQRMAGLLPPQLIRISESGISSSETVLELRKNGFHGFLMGENFMKQSDPGTALEEFVKELTS